MCNIIKNESYSYAFNAKACENCGGKCCSGESGYIWVNDIEIKSIASFLKIDESEFREKMLLKVKYRYSIKEKIDHGNGVACLFFDIKKRSCMIYPVRPTQCRTFPFWEHFKENVKELEKECPGVIKL